MARFHDLFSYSSSTVIIVSKYGAIITGIDIRQPLLTHQESD